VGETEEEKKKRLQDEYCKTCKLVHKDIDCSKCSREIKISDGRK